MRHVSFLNITALKIIIREWKPDGIHIHWQHEFFLSQKSKSKTIIKSLSSLLQLRLLKLLNIKLVWTVHNIIDHECSFPALELLFLKSFARLLDGIIVHCEVARSELIESLQLKTLDKVFHIPHGSMLGFYPNKISQNEARHILDISRSDVVFLFFGQVRPYKGIMELIDAFTCLDCQQCKLLIVGKPIDDHIAKDINKIAQNKASILIHFDFIADDSVQIYANASDVMVFPYRDILTSGATELALAFAKPVIAPRLGCISENLDETGSFLYDPSRKSGLFDAMRKAINHRAEHQVMGKHNLCLAKKYQWKAIAKSTYQVYMNSFE
jgi:glycosyltransferase involved in cell wall biosynthesis